MPFSVVAHHNTLIHEDNKIETQNKKVRSTHNAMVKNMARIEDLTASRDTEIPSNMISKALKSLERSN
jgi:hypothetical protein